MTLRQIASAFLLACGIAVSAQNSSGGDYILQSSAGVKTALDGLASAAIDNGGKVYARSPLSITTGVDTEESSIRITLVFTVENNAIVSSVTTMRYTSPDPGRRSNLYSTWLIQGEQSMINTYGSSTEEQGAGHWVGQNERSQGSTIVTRAGEAVNMVVSFYQRR